MCAHGKSRAMFSYIVCLSMASAVSPKICTFKMIFNADYDAKIKGYVDVISVKLFSTFYLTLYYVRLL